MYGRREAFADMTHAPAAEIAVLNAASITGEAGKFRSRTSGLRQRTNKRTVTGFLRDIAQPVLTLLLWKVGCEVRFSAGA